MITIGYVWRYLDNGTLVEPDTPDLTWGFDQLNPYGRFGFETEEDAITHFKEWSSNRNIEGKYVLIKTYGNSL